MDTEKLKALAEEMKAKAEEIIACCGEDYEEEDDSSEDSEEYSSEDKKEEKPSGEKASPAMSGKNLAVLIALKKKMGK
jgi:hypothetical protein